MKIALHHVAVHDWIDIDSKKMRVEYTPEGGDTTIDYGTYIISTNSYYPNIDLEKQPEREDEFYALQERVEAR